MSRFPEIALASLLMTTPAFAEPLGLGRTALPEEIAAWDIDIRPDGLGLPEGRGNAWDGMDLYEAQCAHCHGVFGEAVGNWPQLAGGFGTLTDEHPVKTIGSYWPFASTVWDYVNRAMPYGAAQTLEPDEVYAITAYLLYLNDLVDDDFELSHENFAEVRLPNEDGFYLDDRKESEWPTFTQAPCMSDCIPGEAQVTMRAAVLDVTPDQDHSVLRDAAPDTAEAEVGSEAPAEPDPELVAAGERAFRACAACHAVGEGARNGVGPSLDGIVGSPAARADGFRYSPALTAAAGDGLVWTEEELVAFIENPRQYLSGNRMSYAGMRNAEDRAAVVAYLSTFGD
jgi:S-disulfanyl-L-cysteine oxidoreductase SoxD